MSTTTTPTTPMPPATLAALRDSIAHWETMAKEGYATAYNDYCEAKYNDVPLPPHNPTATNCALCRSFLRVDCYGCPIADAGHEFCEDTPFESADAAWCAGDQLAFKRHAAAEVDFLCGLLPAGEER